MKHLQSKISKTLVIYILLFSSCVTLILTIIQLRIDYKHDIGVIKQRLDQIRLTNLDSIKQSVWTMDSDAIKVQLDGLRRLPDIIDVELVDANNFTILKFGEINTTHIISEEYPLYQYYKNRDILIGTLKTVATKENVYKKLIDTAIVILISQGIKTFLVSFFILIIFYYLITRHLSRIARYSESVDLLEKPKLISLNRNTPKFQKDDELDHLVSSLNKMIESNYSNYSKLNASQNLLKKSQSEFTAIFDSITDVVVFADTDRRIVKVNPAMFRVFGYTGDEIIGHTTEILYEDTDQYKHQGDLRYQNNMELKPTVYEINYRRKDGSVFPSETLGGQVRLPDGTHIGYVGIIRDITERKRSENEYKQLQNQLQQTQKMEAIGSLAGGIAHDFNNILASIIGYGELAMLQTDINEKNKLHTYLSNIVNSGERGKKLVAQMMAFSRNTAQELTSVNLSEILEEAINILKPTLSSGIQITTTLDPGIPPVLIDKTQMHQIIMNLCINARDAMSGQGNLNIELHFKSDIRRTCDSCGASFNGDFVMMVVRDTGAGIAPDIKSRIFDPFVTSKGIGKGTGMGLSVVHGILHRHNAHVCVESIQGSGTVFSLYFPRAENTKNDTFVAVNNKINIKPNDGSGRHILVVDDEELITSYLQSYLESYGYTVTVTNTSVEALALLNDSISFFDLLLTDQTMPDLMGNDLAKKAIKLRPNFPVIICSGYSERINEEEIKSLGNASYLAKPINNNKLLFEIKRLLANHY